MTKRGMVSEGDTPPTVGNFCNCTYGRLVAAFKTEISTQITRCNVLLLSGPSLEHFQWDWEGGGGGCGYVVPHSR